MSQREPRRAVAAALDVQASERFGLRVTANPALWDLVNDPGDPCVQHLVSV